MPAIGITGGIATGKSAFSARIQELLPRATFFDADRVARELTDRDDETRALISSTFGSDIYSAAGDLNRAQLRSIVFADAEKKRALEQILHPRIRRQWSDESQRHASDLFLADIPLLYETSGESLCDRTVVVACAPDVQRERLMARTGLAQAEVAEMIEAQMPLEEKMRRADHVVWNNGGREVLREQARLLVGLWREVLWKKK